VDASDDSSDSDDESEEDVEAARLLRFRLRFLAGAFAAAGGIVKVDEHQSSEKFCDLRKP
jgi:hypothetical protein